MFLASVVWGNWRSERGAVAVLQVIPDCRREKFEHWPKGARPLRRENMARQKAFDPADEPMGGPHGKGGKVQGNFRRRRGGTDSFAAFALKRATDMTEADL